MASPNQQQQRRGGTPNNSNAFARAGGNSNKPKPDDKAKATDTAAKPSDVVEGADGAEGAEGADGADTGDQAGAAGAGASAPKRRGVAPKVVTLDMMRKCAEACVKRLGVFLSQFKGVSMRIVEITPESIEQPVTSYAIVLRDTTETGREFTLASFNVKEGWRREVALGSKSGQTKGLAATDVEQRVLNDIVMPAFEKSVRELNAARGQAGLLQTEKLIIDRVWPGKSADDISADQMFVRPYIEENELRIDVRIPSDVAQQLGEQVARQVVELVSLIRRGTMA